MAQSTASVSFDQWPPAVRGPLTADYTEALPGRVSLEITVEGTAQTVVIERRAAPGTAVYRGRQRIVLGAARCITPCRLHVPVGEYVLRAQGPGTRPTDTTVMVSPEGSTVRLRPSSRALFNLGTGFVGAGGAIFIATAAIALVHQAASTAPTDGDVLPGISTPAAAALGLAAVAFLCAGIPLMVLNRGGIATQHRPATLLTWGTGAALRFIF